MITDQEFQQVKERVTQLVEAFSALSSNQINIPDLPNSTVLDFENKMIVNQFVSGVNTQRLTTIQQLFEFATTINFDAIVSIVKTVDNNSLLLTDSQGVEAEITALNIAFIQGLQAALDDKENKSEKGVANGYVPLNSAIKIALEFLPDSVLGGLRFIDVWNASTNTPTIPDATDANKGNYYVVETAGNTDINGVTDWEQGDWVVSNGTEWHKIDNTDAVSSVNGLKGVVVLDADDISDDTTTHKFATADQLTKLDNLDDDEYAKLNEDNEFTGQNTFLDEPVIIKATAGTAETSIKMEGDVTQISE